MTIVGHGYDENLTEPHDQHVNPPNKKLTVLVSGPGMDCCDPHVVNHV